MSAEGNRAGNHRPLAPPKKYGDELRASLDQAERGEFLDSSTSEAYVRWLETGEGPCPSPVESSS